MDKSWKDLVNQMDANMTPIFITVVSMVRNSMHIHIVNTVIFIRTIVQSMFNFETKSLVAVNGYFINYQKVDHIQFSPEVRH